jgi:hypothetical protein
MFVLSWGGSLCRNVTFTEQLLSDGQGELPNVTRNGKDNRDSVTFSFELFLWNSTGCDESKVSAIVIWRGSTPVETNSIACGDVEFALDRSTKSSKSVLGMDSSKGEEEGER